MKPILVKMIKGLQGIPPDMTRSKRKNIAWHEWQVVIQASTSGKSNSKVAGVYG